MVVCEARSQTLLPLLTYIGQAIDSKLAFESILWFQSQDQTTASKSWSTGAREWVKDRQEGHGWPWLVWKLQRCYNSKYMRCNSTSTCGGGLNLVIVSTCGGGLNLAHKASASHWWCGEAAIGDQLSIQPHPWLSMAINMVISQSRNGIVITISMIIFFIIIFS